MNAHLGLPQSTVEEVRSLCERVRTGLHQGDGSSDEATAFIAYANCISPARSIAELILDKRRETKTELETHVPHFDLVYRLRIQDFHRHPLLPCKENATTIDMLGPITLTASKGRAFVSIGPKGHDKRTSGESSIKEDKTVYRVDNSFYDETTGRFHALQEILRDYIKGIELLMLGEQKAK